MLYRDRHTRKFNIDPYTSCLYAHTMNEWMHILLSTLYHVVRLCGWHHWDELVDVRIDISSIVAVFLPEFCSRGGKRLVTKF